MFAAEIAGSLAERVRISLNAGCDAALVCHPKDVRGLLAESSEDYCDKSYSDADQALRRLKSKSTLSREELESVAEWQHWKNSINQLEQSKWA
jgi:beta-glucosidase-like glycosyl hydrolase